jgi:hypothetical protein
MLVAVVAGIMEVLVAPAELAEGVMEVLVLPALQAQQILAVEEAVEITPAQLGM